jgi:hypothetical protein
VQIAVELPNGVSEQSVLDAAEAVASGGGAKEVFLKAANGFVK